MRGPARAPCEACRWNGIALMVWTLPANGCGLRAHYGLQGPLHGATLALRGKSESVSCIERGARELCAGSTVQRDEPSLWSRSTPGHSPSARAFSIPPSHDRITGKPALLPPRMIFTNA